MPKTSEPSPNFPTSPNVILGNEDHPFTADIHTRLWCFYCKRSISIKTFGQHFSNMCEQAVIASGRDWKNVKTSRNTTRQQSDKKRFQNMDNVIARNQVRWRIEFEKKNPKPEPPPKLPLFWDVPKRNPFYWNQNELPELNDLKLRQQFHDQLSKATQKATDRFAKYVKENSDGKLNRAKKRANLMEHRNAFRSLKESLGINFRTT